MRDLVTSNDGDHPGGQASTVESSWPLQTSLPTGSEIINQAMLGSRLLLDIHLHLQPQFHHYLSSCPCHEDGLGALEALFLVPPLSGYTDKLWVGPLPF